MGVGFRVRVAVGNDRYLARSRDEFISLVRTLPRFVSLNGFVSLLYAWWCVGGVRLESEPRDLV